MGSSYLACRVDAEHWSSSRCANTTTQAAPLAVRVRSCPRVCPARGLSGGRASKGSARDEAATNGENNAHRHCDGKHGCHPGEGVNK